MTKHRLNPTARTAIVRRELSLPVRWLLRANLIGGRPALDYGCGRGTDAKFLGIDGFDPHWAPELPGKQYNVILCTYVLNVLTEAEAEDVIDHIKSLLTPAGVAYVTVRRDMPHDYVTSSGLVQRLVELPYRVVRETSAYCIYEVERED